MRLVVEPRIFDYFPGLHLAVAVARDLHNAASEGLERRWREAWQSAGALDLPNAQSHPYVNAWREQLRGAGVSAKKFPTSIEAMLRRALKGGEPFHINPLVDFYNALSLRHVAPAGAWDLDEVPEDLHLRFTRPGDCFTALDASEAIAVAEDEIAYACGKIVLTRHFMWRQARQALVHAETRNVFLVSEVPGIAGRDVAEAMRLDMVSGLEQHFGVESASAILDRGRPVFDAPPL